MNPVVHFEIPYENPERVTQFYEQVFGWRTQMLGAGMNNYISARTAESDVTSGSPAGAIDGGFYPKRPDWPLQHPSIVIAVENIEEFMNKVIGAGGEVIGEPMSIPDVGLYVSFTDTEGNRNSMLQPME